MKIKVSKKNLKKLSVHKKSITPDNTPQVAGGYSGYTLCHSRGQDSCFISICTQIACPPVLKTIACK